MFKPRSLHLEYLDITRMPALGSTCTVFDSAALELPACKLHSNQLQRTAGNIKFDVIFQRQISTQYSRFCCLLSALIIRTPKKILLWWHGHCKPRAYNLGQSQPVDNIIIYTNKGNSLHGNHFTVPR